MVNGGYDDAASHALHCFIPSCKIDFSPTSPWMASHCITSWGLWHPAMRSPVKEEMPAGKERIQRAFSFLGGSTTHCRASSSILIERGASILAPWLVTLPE